MRKSQSNNGQLLSIAARDDELRAPVQTMQTYDINSHDRPVDATDHQRNCLVTATATATVTDSMMTAGPRQSFVRSGLHPLCGGRGRQRQREAATRATLSASVLLVLAMSCRVDRIARLSRCQAKTIKVRSEEKANYFINEHKVGN